MAKKNPYVFTIGFNPKDPDHVRVADLLNEQGKGNIAAFLVRAVRAYEGYTKPSFDPQAFEKMVKQIVEEQFAEQLEKQPPSPTLPPIVKTAPLDSSAQKNILNGLAGFRKK